LGDWTVLFALGGTSLGVLIAVPFVGLTRAEPSVLWIVLPLLVFRAAYAPVAVSFVAGQIAFSVLVVVLLIILAPTDWQIGFVRVENAALGVAISAIVGHLPWPRGTQGQLRSALADLYEVWARLLSSGFLLVGDMLDWLSEHGYAAAGAGAPTGRLALLADTAVSSIVHDA